MKIDLDNKIVRFLVQEYVNKICYYASEEELNYNVHKLIHTFGVVDMAQKLLDETSPTLPKKIQQQILNAAILHDVGRCYEFENGEKVHIDHGKVGAELIKKQFPKMETEMLSTLMHNKLASDKDPQSCQPVLDYVRDADMLANLTYEIENTDIFLKHIWGNKKEASLTPKIDLEIFNATKEKRSPYTSKIKIRNLLNMSLWQMCWYYNLRTSAGIKYAKKEKVFVQFRETIIKKIIPLTTEDEKKQKELTQKIQEIFPDKLFA